MNDFGHLEKTIIRELSCRLCLCTDVSKLKPLSTEVKRKLKRLFDIIILSDDNLPKAICHECLQNVCNMYLYAVQVDKIQKFLEFHKMKTSEDKEQRNNLISVMMLNNTHPEKGKVNDKDKDKEKASKNKPQAQQQQQSDAKLSTPPKAEKKKTSKEMKLMESMPLEEFATEENVDKTLLNKGTRSPIAVNHPKPVTNENINNLPINNKTEARKEAAGDLLDPVVLIDGKPAKQGAELDKQISLFYQMECCICHENGFHFRSLMRHYKERHGVPGYVSCCNKKFHYFYPKKILEHMAFHLQPNIFMCKSCHTNFQTSQELNDHQNNGGRSEGKIFCPRCNERYPTYRELGTHIVIHRTDRMQCDYCGKQLKHHHRKKTINGMRDVIVCSQCVRTLRSIERQEKEIKDRNKASKKEDAQTAKKLRAFRQAMGLSGDEDTSSD